MNHHQASFRPGRILLGVILGALTPSALAGAGDKARAVKPADVLAGLRDFYKKTARADGSFRPGIDRQYEGMADSAASDLAAVTYAVVLHKTFGWQLPHEARTKAWLLGRQQADGAFVNRRGTLDPASAAARLYNTTQGLVALHALGRKPKYDPRPVFAQILKKDYKTLPAYTTSFFPLAYLAYGKPFPADADRKIRALMTPARDGYLFNHIASTFHMVHYDRLLNQKTARVDAMLKRAVREQKADGSWLLNPPARDRHATFDAVFVLHQLGKDRPECRRAIRKAAAWALRCRNADGGFGHYPGSPSDADAVYFQVGTLVMAGFLKPVDPLPKEPELFSWGHLMPRPQEKGRR
jgi:geranylgeranyl transferase type-2 subunit beta